ncbi:hypothetical protein EON71_00905 [bacterium]|nr:MAG: hypothetical protein EON71_00905 [bacterium]
MKNKIFQSVTASIIVTKLGFSERCYTTLFGGLDYKPKIFVEETQVLICNLSDAMYNRDKSQIYCNILLSAVNHKNWMPYHNKDLIEKMTRSYNSQFSQNDSTRLSVGEFLLNNKIDYNQSSLPKDSRFFYHNLTEILAIEYVNRADLGFSVKANYDNNLRIANLGFQPNNDCIGVLLKHPVTGVPMMYYFDVKNSTIEQIMKKLEYTNLQGKSIHLVCGSGQRFGCNVYVVATSKEHDIVLNINEKAEMLKYLSKLAAKHPEIYLGFFDSEGFKDFDATGNWEKLNSCGYPVPIVARAHNLVTPEVIEAAIKTPEYQRLLQKMPESKDNYDSTQFNLNDNT